MIDTVKVTYFKRAIGIVCLILIFCIGFGFGQMGKNSQDSSETKVSTTNKSDDKRLDESLVKKFLIAYYTKKDLEENRQRYKEYMTEGLYNATISEENKAQSQTYKGYIINYAFESAQIYIDNINHQVICKVTYTNDLLKEKNNAEGAQKGVINHTTIQLDYAKVNGNFLVNHMSTLLLTDSSDLTESEAAYGAITPSETD